MTESGSQRYYDAHRVAFIALAALLLGISYYWLARPEHGLLLFPMLPTTKLLVPSLVAHWLGWLPTAAHVFSFSLLTWLSLGGRHPTFACVLWCVVNAGFELGQALPVGVIDRFPDILNIRNYLTNGVFDWLDLTACVVGAWAAWSVLPKCNRQDKGVTRDTGGTVATAGDDPPVQNGA